MTTVAEALGVVRSRFEALVAGPLALRTYYDNFPEDEPEATAPWVFLRAVIVASPTVEGGDGFLVRDHGLLTAHVFGPIGRGNRIAYETATAIEIAFARKGQDGVRFRDARWQDIGAQTPWYRIKLEISFDSERVEQA